MFTSFPFAFWRHSADTPSGFGPNYGYEFDGVDEYIDFGDVLDNDGTSAFSISTRVRFNDTSSNCIFSKYPSSLLGYGLYTINQKITFIMGSGSGNYLLVEGSNINQNEWANVTVIYDGSKNASGVSIYINGVLDTLTTVSDTLTGSSSNTGEFRIGAFQNTNIYNCNGRADDFQYYDFELNSTQVSDIYNSGYVTAPTASPIHHWKLGESDSFSTNWTVTDSVGSLNGTSVNMEEEDRKLGVAYSMEFDGVDEYADFGSIGFPTNPSTPFSIGVWLKQLNLGVFTFIFGSSVSSDNRGVQIATSGNGIYIQIRQDVANRILTSISGKSSTEWNFVLITYNGNSDTSGVSIYLNSVLGTKTDSDNTLSPTDNISGGDVLVGKTATGFNANADIMNCMIFDTELSASDAVSLYNNGVPVDPRDVSLTPSFFAPLGGPNDSWNGTNWTFVDEINGNNGTSVNMEEADKTSETP